MSYPMTWQRFVKRNGLEDGGYGQTPTRYDYADQSVERFKSALALMAGDLQRLERDAQDEGALLGYLTTKTGVDPEAIALVLKEFFAW